MNSISTKDAYQMYYERGLLADCTRVDSGELAQIIVDIEELHSRQKELFGRFKLLAIEDGWTQPPLEENYEYDT